MLRTHLNRQLHRQMDSELDLAFDLDLDTSLLGALFKPLFETLFQQSFATLFGSMFVSMSPLLYVSIDPALFGQKQGGRRPVGRPLPGRIVVLRPANTIRCGAYVAPCVHLRMIRILITRILSLVPLNSALCAHYSQLAGKDTPAGGRLSPGLCQALWQSLCRGLRQALRQGLSQTHWPGLW